MPRRTKAQLARDKARKQIQNLFDKFRDPDGRLTGYSGHLLLDGPAYFDDNYLTHHQVKLLPFDVSDTAIPNSAPSFFKPWPVSKLKDHPVDVKAMGGEDLESLEISNPFPDPSDPLDSARDVEEFIGGQYFHIPRANLGPGNFETLSRHSEWRLVSLPHALLEYNQGITPYPLAPSTSPWDTRDILEYGDDPTPPHIIATTMNGVEGVDMKLLRSELISILQLMVNRLGEEGHENDAIVPVLIFSIMSARRGRLLQAFSDGEHLVIQMTKLLSCEDKNSPFINHAFRYLMSEAVGDTSGLSDVAGTKATV